MLRPMKGIVLFLLTVLPLSAAAGVYKWVDEDGNIHYSDRPVEQAEDVQFPGLFPAAKTPAPSNGSADAPLEESPPDAQGGGGAYTQLLVLEPEQNQTFRSDQGEVSIALLLEPALQPGHQFRFSLDGSDIPGQFTSTQMVIRQISRGTHTLQVKIVDAEGNPVAASNSVNFHMRKASTRPAFAGQ